MKTAVLLSGGIDSIAILHWLTPDAAITVDYGQRPAEGEIAASGAVCDHTNTPHHVLRVACGELGIGTMCAEQEGGQIASPYPDRPEWWPYRNQLIVTAAAAVAMPLGFGRLLIGTVKNDECHGDGTSEFISAMNQVLQIQEGNLSLDAPAIHLDTVELIRQSGVPASLLAWAHSCHVAPSACGQCRGCVKHQEVIAKIN